MTVGISIHALRGEGDVLPIGTAYLREKISIHALRGEGDLNLFGGYENENISIHALRGEGDRRLAVVRTQGSHFNPRPPWGGRR